MWYSLSTADYRENQFSTSHLYMYMYEKQANFLRKICFCIAITSIYRCSNRIQVLKLLCQMFFDPYKTGKMCTLPIFSACGYVSALVQNSISNMLAFGQYCILVVHRTLSKGDYKDEKIEHLKWKCLRKLVI
jgi:hypothetical protein